MTMWPFKQIPEYSGTPGPYGYLEGPKEEPERIWEGEFRHTWEEPELDVREEELGERPPMGVPILEEEPGETEAQKRSRLREEIERRKREEAKEKWERGLKRKRLQLAEAELRQEKRKLGEDIWGRTERITKRGAKTAGFLYKLGTLGGTPKVSKGARELYIPKADKGLYLGDRDVLRETTRMPMEGVRRATRFPTREESPIAGMVIPTMKGLVSVKGQSVALGMLRQASIPKGLSQIEKFAFAEVVGNGDRDTVQNVITDLRALGIPSVDAEHAIRLLLQKGLVRKTHDFKGEEPVLEVVR